MLLKLLLLLLLIIIKKITFTFWCIAPVWYKGLIVKVFLVNYQAYEKSKIRFLELSLGLIFPDQYLTVVCKAEVKAALVDNDHKTGAFLRQKQNNLGVFLDNFQEA